jgi:hypothetical protein
MTIWVWVSIMTTFTLGAPQSETPPQPPWEPTVAVSGPYRNEHDCQLAMLKALVEEQRIIDDTNREAQQKGSMIRVRMQHVCRSTTK